eukprot:TRINITY_DN4184_c0_g1_i1.p1 TRINITY_DN4184_c0_g1~~TRINITY_DN4184_c0_g1_i1.p1  ORF type:complete len:1156 (-),score=1.43 TRINITY_DN4184_c0_g1_i1:1240-4707(-)
MSASSRSSTHTSMHNIGLCSPTDESLETAELPRPRQERHARDPSERPAASPCVSDLVVESSSSSSCHIRSQHKFSPFSVSRKSFSGLSLAANHSGQTSSWLHDYITTSPFRTQSTPSSTETQPIMRPGPVSMSSLSREVGSPSVGCVSGAEVNSAAGRRAPVNSTNENGVTQLTLAELGQSSLHPSPSVSTLVAMMSHSPSPDALQAFVPSLAELSAACVPVCAEGLKSGLPVGELFDGVGKTKTDGLAEGCLNASEACRQPTRACAGRLLPVPFFAAIASPPHPSRVAFLQGLGGPSVSGPSCLSLSSQKLGGKSTKLSVLDTVDGTPQSEPGSLASVGSDCAPKQSHQHGLFAESCGSSDDGLHNALPTESPVYHVGIVKSVHVRRFGFLMESVGDFAAVERARCHYNAAILSAGGTIPLEYADWTGRLAAGDAWDDSALGFETNELYREARFQARCVHLVPFLRVDGRASYRPSFEGVEWTHDTGEQDGADDRLHPMSSEGPQQSSATQLPFPPASSKPKLPLARIQAVDLVPVPCVGRVVVTPCRRGSSVGIIMLCTEASEASRARKGAHEKASSSFPPPTHTTRKPPNPLPSASSSMGGVTHASISSPVESAISAGAHTQTHHDTVSPAAAASLPLLSFYAFKQSVVVPRPGHEDVERQVSPGDFVWFYPDPRRLPVAYFVCPATPEVSFRQALTSPLPARMRSLVSALTAAVARSMKSGSSAASCGHAAAPRVPASNCGARSRLPLYRAPSEPYGRGGGVASGSNDGRTFESDPHYGHLLHLLGSKGNHGRPQTSAGCRAVGSVGGTHSFPSRHVGSVGRAGRGPPCVSSHPNVGSRLASGHSVSSTDWHGRPGLPFTRNGNGVAASRAGCNPMPTTSSRTASVAAAPTCASPFHGPDAIPNGNLASTNVCQLTGEHEADTVAASSSDSHAASGADDRTAVLLALLQAVANLRGSSSGSRSDPLPTAAGTVRPSQNESGSVGFLSASDQTSQAMLSCGAPSQPLPSSGTSDQSTIDHSSSRDTMRRLFGADCVSPQRSQDISDAPSIDLQGLLQAPRAPPTPSPSQSAQDLTGFLLSAAGITNLTKPQMPSLQQESRPPNQPEDGSSAPDQSAAHLLQLLMLQQRLLQPRTPEHEERGQHGPVSRLPRP